MNKFGFLLTLSLTMGFAPSVFAADVPQSFTLDGRLYKDTNQTTPLIDGSIVFKIQILDEDRTCVLYEETQSTSTLASQGYFSVQVGSGTADARRSPGDSGNSMATVFQNIAGINGRLLSNGNPCTVAAVSSKRRYVRTSITPSTMGGGARTLSPDLNIDSVPNAIVAERAESLQGLRSTDVLKVNVASGSALSQTNLESLFSSTTRFNSLSSVVDGTSTSYMRSNSASGAQLPVLTGAPTSPTAGAIWYDSTDSKLKYQTSGGPIILGSGSGSVTSVGFTAPNELTVTGAPVTSSGTIAIAWANQTTNKVLAAPDGSTGAPTFRALTAADIPGLAWTKITSLVPTTLAGYGITDAVKNAGGTPSLQSGLDAAKGSAATAGRIWISTDTKLMYRDNGTTWDLIGGGGAPSGTAGGDLTGTYPNPTVGKLQGVSVSTTTPTAGQVLKYAASAWTPSNFSIGDLKTAAGTQQFAGSASCTAAQTLTWSSLTDTFTCSNIAGLDAGTITTGTIATARLPASSTAWTVNGSDVYRTGGNVGIGTLTPAGTLDVQGGTAVAGNGTSLSFVAQSGFTTGNTNGGNIYLTAGAANGTGVPGVVTMNQYGLNFAGATGSGGGNPPAGFNGFYSSGLNRLDFGTNGLNRFSVLANGNVVMGSPTTMIVGNAFVDYNTNLNGFAMDATGSYLRTAGNKRLTVDNTGYVGIGTTSPGSMLDVKGAIRLSGATSGYTGFQPAAAAGSTVWTLPNVDGSSGQFLSTNGSGILSWASASGNVSGGGGTPSYSNPGGMGSRPTITATASAGLFGSGSPSNLLDGVNGNDTWFSNGFSTAGAWILFNFGATHVINEAKLVQDSGTAQGTWQWQGSNDGVTFTNIGSSFALGVGNTKTMTSLNGNTTAYQYYRMLGVSGVTNYGPYVYEFLFSIDSTYANWFQTTSNGAYFSNGNVGIGTSAPANTLDVNGTISTIGATGSTNFGTGQIVASGPSGGGAGLYINTPNTAGSYGGFGVGFGTTMKWLVGISKNAADTTAMVFYEDGAAANPRLTVGTGGNVGIGLISPTTKLQVAGIISPSADNTYTLGNATHRFSDIYSMNAANNTSDRREKKQIQDSDLGLAFISSLRPVSYVWKSGGDRGLHYGLIAQETEQAVANAKNQPANKRSPVIVTYDEKSDRYGIRYTELIAPVIKAIQELHESLTGQDKKIREQAAEIASLKAYLCAKEPTADICR